MIILCLPLLLTLAVANSAQRPPPAGSQSISNAPVLEMKQPPAKVNEDQESITDSATPEWLESWALEANKPHEVSIGRCTLEGVAVELLQTHNPLDLINAVVPESRDWMDDNTMREMTTRQASGLKILELKF